MSKVIKNVEIWLILHSRVWRAVEHSICYLKHHTTGLDREHKVHLRA